MLHVFQAVGGELNLIGQLLFPKGLIEGVEFPSARLLVKGLRRAENLAEQLRIRGDLKGLDRSPKLLQQIVKIALVHHILSVIFDPAGDFDDGSALSLPEGVALS